jgi:outer membrane protein assembly factor BamE (lipoprotein component of BamABCDE complex)
MNARTLLALVPLGLLSGCIIHADSHTERTGRFVSSETLRQIEPGRSQEYVLALLGEPTTRQRVDGTTEIWKWEYSETRRSEGTLIFVFSGNDSSRVQGATFVEFENGIVRKSWRD